MYHDHQDIDAWTSEIDRRIGDGDLRAIDEALDFLLRDPYHWRSGYAQERVARRVARSPMSPGQRSSARTVALSTVDGERHCPQPGVGKLAGAAANNELRRALRSRLHSPDVAIARRALTTVVHVRHPGFTVEWAEELRSITKAHGPDRKGARRLLDRIGRPSL